MNTQIFSESWYIIATLRVSLLSTVTVQKQNYRGSEWYILKDSFNNKFFRIKPEAYQFIMRLSVDKTIEEYWEEYLVAYPKVTPTQDEVVKLLSQLHLNNLLFFKNRAQSLDVFERYTEEKKKMLKSKLFSFLFIKVPIYNPDRLLTILNPVSKIVFSRFGFLIWFLVLAYGIKIVIDNSTVLSSQAQGILSPSNLTYLFVTLFILKILHEFAHAIMCKKFGGPVYTMGLMFLVFTPLPYMDASSSWGFRNKWHRALVGSAGMMVELFIAALAAIIWTNTGDGFLHAMSFNVMIIGSVSSLVFNANPLLKLDAYYIVSDVLEIPNLLKRSNNAFLFLLKKLVFNVEHLISPINTLKEGFWLITYAVLSYGYRLLVSLTIMLFVADQFLILGIIVGIMSFYMWLLKPLWSLFVYLSTSVELNKNRGRATVITLVTLGGFILFLSFIPMPNSIHTSGVLYSKNFTSLYTNNEGYLDELYVENGQSVKAGDAIAKFRNKELELDIAVTETKLEEAYALELKAQQDIADLKPLNKRIHLLKKKLENLKEKKEELVIYAKLDGVWVSDTLKNFKQAFLNEGEHLGDIIPARNFRFIAVVPQEKAFHLFSGEPQNANLKFKGIEERTVLINNMEVIPYKQHVLPSSVLGWQGGGEIKVSQNDPSGTRTVESFFEIRMDVEEVLERSLLFHHRSGVLRIELHNEPLIIQFAKFMEQLMQKRYQI